MAQPNKNAVGPGTVNSNTIAPPPLLGGADENYYAEILNPLSQDFIGKVASSRPVKAPIRIVTNDNTPTLTQSEEDIKRNYGLDLRNKDSRSQQHFVQTVTILSGHTLRLQGNEAQVIIRQLTDIIMDSRDQQVAKGDPTARRQVEEEIVLKVGTMDEFLAPSQSEVRDLLNKDSHESNESEEKPFPSQTEPTRKPGRPPKGSRNPLVPNPPPGHGVTY